MSASAISATDVEVFRRLANAAVVDVQVESRTRKATAEMRQAMERAAAAVAPRAVEEPASPVESCSSRGRKATSNFQRAQEAAAAEAAEATRRREAAPPSPPQRQERPSPAPSPDSSPVARSRRSAPPESPPPRSPRLRRETRPAEDAEEEDEELSERGDARPPRGTEQERLEKQGYLIELSSLRQKGVQLSREFSLSDSLAELEFEVQKQNNNATTRHSVAFMRDMLRIAINGIEIGNSRFGPFLSIDGWAESVTQDMTKYEHALERLYKRYWRKTQMSPVMELGWLLLGSMVAWHFKSKFLGPPAAAPRRETPAPANQRAPPAAPSRATRAATRSTRPVLRPPSSLFSM